MLEIRRQNGARDMPGSFSAEIRHAIHSEVCELHRIL
jgi:hypothetical protein